ncbi:unnamed protein product [Rhizophagus irregularis]|nr:unnamed protein product [Rhizophagus irregularis]CAB5355330.1 unnamed protein product [Rhizophagus irregularis]
MAQINVFDEINTIEREIKLYNNKRSSGDFDMTIKEHKQLFMNVSSHFKTQPIENRLNDDLTKLQSVTDKIHKMVEQQKQETDNIISMTERHINITKRLQEKLDNVQAQVDYTNVLSTYRDWIGEFLREVVRKMKLKSLDEFIQILHNKWFLEDQEDEESETEENEEQGDEESEVEENEEQEDEEDEEQEEDDNILTELKIILEKVGLTLLDFKKLLKMRELSNTKFHKTDLNQTPKEAKKQLHDTDFPGDIADIKVPLEKALDALTLWTKNKKRRNKQNKRKK